MAYTLSTAQLQRTGEGSEEEEEGDGGSTGVSDIAVRRNREHMSGSLESERKLWKTRRGRRAVLRVKMKVYGGWRLPAHRESQHLVTYKTQ